MSIGRRHLVADEIPQRLDALRADLDRCEQVLAQNSRLCRVREIVELRAELPITLRKAADKAALEYTSFSRHFHRSVGVTFSAWLAMLKVARAIELLRDTELPVAVIAQRVGFSRASSLRKAFRRLVGTSARDYRRRCHDGGG